MFDKVHQIFLLHNLVNPLSVRQECMITLHFKPRLPITCQPLFVRSTTKITDCDISIGSDR
jgi:hypothetical protein